MTYNYNMKNKIQTIPLRLNFITELLENNKLEPMIDLDYNNIKEMKIHKNNSVYNCNHKCSKECNDIRCILNKQTYDFKKIITNLGSKLMYIKSGTSGHTFKGIITNNNHDVVYNFAVKVVAYPKKAKYGNIHYKKRPENAELLILKLLSYFVIKKHTPFIVLPIGTFNTSIEPFLQLKNTGIKLSKKYKEFIKRVENNEYYDEVSVLISEWADKGDLLDYLRKNYKTFKTRDWRVIFFQLLSVLAVIQKKYPTFRHNDLKPNNILVQLINKPRKADNYHLHNINGHEFIVPNIGIQLKIWDFDFATIPGIVDNAKVEAEWTNRINVKPEKNRYYDVHYFFNTMIKNGFFSQFLTEPEIPLAVKEFVDRVLPEKYRNGKYVTERGRIKINKEYTTPFKILITDPFFEKMRK